MLIFLNRETTVMSKYNNSTTPALFRDSELINAMHNVCIGRLPGENWAASRLTARSRATVVQIYT